MTHKSIAGIDLGGTNVRGALVTGNTLGVIRAQRLNSRGSIDEVLADLFAFTDQLIDRSVASIGIGVPGLVNVREKIVQDVVHIPAWKQVPLQAQLEDRYGIPVRVNNDANCFALGEYYFGKGRGAGSLVGVTIGTGLGSGIIINHQLYDGSNGGAGEFGMMEYLDHTLEYYASGQFFQNIYQTDGSVVFNDAARGDAGALRKYDELGFHLGKAIKIILYSLDVDLIILGGSVRHAFPYFSKSMWHQIQNFGFQNAARSLRVEVSQLENAGILGAAALVYPVAS